MATRPSGRRTALAYETKNATVGLEPVEQLCCVCLLCQSAEHHACHGRVEEHFACFDQALEIAAHAPVPSDPSQGSLNGLIANDKLCLSRAGRLRLSWPRARGRLRASAPLQLGGEVTHRG